jgi:hypothetical protein
MTACLSISYSFKWCFIAIVWWNDNVIFKFSMDTEHRKLIALYILAMMCLVATIQREYSLTATV